MISEHYMQRHHLACDGARHCYVERCCPSTNWRDFHGAQPDEGHQNAGPGRFCLQAYRRLAHQRSESLRKIQMASRLSHQSL